MFSTATSFSLIRNLRRRLIASALLLVSVTMTAVFSPVVAQSNRALTDELLDRQFDWIMYLDIKKLNHYLNYEHSSLKPVYKMELTYRWSPRNKRKERPPGIFQYEDLYFSENKVIGMHRYQKLPYQTNEQGCIWIRPQENVPEEVQALTDCIVRAVLDIYQTKSVLATIYVPLNNFENFASAFGLYHFFKFEMAVPGGPGQNMSIHVSSDPKLMERYFYYDDEGRR